MVLDQYTQNLIIRNSKELVKNGKINLNGGYIESVTSLASGNTPNDLKKKYIISPGFINLHSHLAYTHLELESKNLFAWLKDLMLEMKQQSFDAEAASLAGAELAIKSGTTFLVDNTSHLKASFEAFKKTSLRGIIGFELFGSDPLQAKNILETVLRELETVSELMKAFPDASEDIQERIKFCLSPHSLYSISSELWHELLAYLSSSEKKSRRETLSLEKLLLLHFAEDESEEKYFRGGDEDLELMYDFWDSLGLLHLKKQFRKEAKSSWDYFKRYYRTVADIEVSQQQHLEKNTKLKYLLTHAINLSESEIQELAQYPEIALVSCPRSNEFLKHNKANISLWEQYGIKYGLGTDSKASNYDLDLRLELESLALNDNKRGFELLTSSAAEALGMDDKIGSLDNGKYADYVVFELINQDLDLETIDPYALVLDSSATRVKEVFIGGVAVFSG